MIKLTSGFFEGGHNIGKINCDFIQSRLDNFNDTKKPDPTVSSNFSDEIRHNCLNRSGSNHAKNVFQGLSMPVVLHIFSFLVIEKFKKK